ncbi:UNVERIFIED_CONTAM: hypothetical protein FKN15_040993 [Acipenser sinensis]
MLWHRHSVQRQLLQGYLRAGVGCGGAAVLCTDHWGATGSCGGYLTVSVLFVDRDWRQARCVLETRPAPEPQGLRDALGGVLAQFGLPESAVLGVVLDRPGPSLPLRSPGGLAGWQGLPCAALWLGECVAEALSLDPVQEALAAARVIVTHFQQDPGRAALLNPDEAGAGGSSSKARLPPPDQPARWVTTLAMCEGLLELRWVVSSVLEGGGGSPPVPNLADHQWRLLQELLPALRTVRLAASFLSEEPNAPVSALLPCLHGVARLLGSQLGECGLQAARVQRQLLQGYLRAGVGCGGAAVLCTDHWGATGSCGGYLTVSVLFVDRDWRQARCVLETRPAPEPQGLRDALGGVLAQFGLPESAVLGVVLDRPGPSLPLRSPGGLAGWQGLPCAALWLGECVAEALSLDPVQEALAAARVIVTHFQQDPGRAALLNPDEAGAGGSSSKARLPPPDQPARWVTTLAMCEGLLELRWVVSSVLEGGGSPPVPNLADHQWRLLQELLPALRTVRLAASFLSEEPNASVSALLPCLHGVARLLGSQLGECGLQAARSAIGRMRGAMQKRWRIGEGVGEEEEEEEEMLLDSPLVLSSFLDPRFKELRFLSPDARSRLHGRVKELLSVQREEGEEEAGEGEGAGGAGGGGGGGGGGESSPMSCVSTEGHDLQAGGEGCRISMVVVGAHGNSQWSPPPPPPPSVYDVLLGEDPTERMPAILQNNVKIDARLRS